MAGPGDDDAENSPFLGEKRQRIRQKGHRRRGGRIS